MNRSGLIKTLMIENKLTKSAAESIVSLFSDEISNALKRATKETAVFQMREGIEETGG